MDITKVQDASIFSLTVTVIQALFYLVANCHAVRCGSFIEPYPTRDTMIITLINSVSAR